MAASSTPLFNGLKINVCVDSDHNVPHDKLMSCSITGLIIFWVIILWYLFYSFIKWQGVIESSIYGDKFLVMKLAVELVSLVHYIHMILKCLGVPLTKASQIHGDTTRSIVTINCTVHSALVLKKKRVAIAYHMIYTRLQLHVVYILSKL